MEQNDLITNFSLEKYRSIVKSAFDFNDPLHKKSESILNEFKNNKFSCFQIDSILSYETDPMCVLVALQILEVTIKNRWSLLQSEIKVKLRDYLITQIVKRSQSCNILLEKFNFCLVEILKRDWPSNYKSFIPDIVGSAQTEMGMCANTFRILKRLNEEINIGEVTTVRRVLLIQTFRSEFSYVYNLANSVLCANISMDLPEDLVNSCLEACHSFVMWMSVNFLVESQIIGLVCSFVNSPYTTNSLVLLSKIIEKRNLHESSLDVVEENYFLDQDNNKSMEHYQNEEFKYKIFFGMQMQKAKENYTKIVTHNPAVIPSIYWSYNTINSLSNIELNSLPQFENVILKVHETVISFLVQYFSQCVDVPLHLRYPGFDILEKNFIQQIVVFLTTCYTKINHLETKSRENVNRGLHFLVRIAKIEDKTLYRKILEFINSFTSEICKECILDYEDMKNTQNLFKSNKNAHNRLQNERSIQSNTRVSTYKSFLLSFSEVMIQKMPRPEEVFITKDEYGDVVKERITQSDEIEYIGLVRETFKNIGLLYRDNLTLSIINKLIALDDNYYLKDKKPSKDVNDIRIWNHENLNKICWSAGCLAEVCESESDHDFFVSVLKNLLSSCESKTSKNDKAFVASNILFFVGRASRYLRENERFTLTVIKKLFEFMNENHDGIREMSCDTFFKIATTTGSIIINLTDLNNHYFSCILREGLVRQTSQLSNFQKRIVYNSCLNIIANINNENEIGGYLNHLEERIFESLKTKQNVTIFFKNLHQIDESYFEDIVFLKNLSHVIKSYNLISDKFCKIFLEKDCCPWILNLLNRIQNKTSKAISTLKEDILNLFNSILEILQYEDETVESRQFKVLLVTKLKDFYMTNKTSAVLYTVSLSVNKWNDNIAQRSHYIIENFIKPILESCERNEFAAGYYNLIHNILSYSFSEFFNLIFSEREVFNKIYTSLLNGITKDIQISKISIKSILIMTQGACDMNIFAFMQDFSLTTLEHIIYTLIDKECSYTIDLQAMLLNTIIVKIINSKIMKYSPNEDNVTFITQYIKNMLKSIFDQPSEDYLTCFISGLFILSNENNPYFLRDHMIDFRIGLTELNSNDYIHDEYALINQRKALLINSSQ